ncbi:STAS domain-containing protein [Saccharopolyspora sp. K220]|uniref:STAS domain-containing protein n=1 Tax=Saccharopolyspora soli TaxID=2926618 RepID=UPI001F59AB05|nr:STAS domain-containing protein [Saccharopolyspora soli]MCI2419312.1 STAS domain-containing protein [Saccharopolyspora soli]
MATRRPLHPDPASELLFRSADVRADLWRRAALAELADMAGHAFVAALTDEADEMTITSVQRGAHYTVVAVSGPVDSRATRQLAAHLNGLHNAGAHHLVVDLSRVTNLDENLLDLMRRVEARVLARNGVFELTGLAPNVLYAMEDGPLSEVFALYRATLEEAGPQAVSWAALRCPQGLAEVPEPRTARRHRSIFDVSARPRGGRVASTPE